MPNPQFNALTGPEALKFILHTIEKRLVDTGEFSENITFPWWKMTYEVSVLSYPKRDPEKDEPNIKVSGSVQPMELPKDVGPEPVVVTEVKDTLVVDVPDQARVDSNQPILSPQIGVGGVIVDKPVVIPKKGK